MPLPWSEPPVELEVAKPFWEAIGRGEVALPRCSVCRRWEWYPSAGGPACAGGTYEWVPLPGTGRVFAFTRVLRRFLPDGAAPYVVGLVELDGAEGPRLVANLDEAVDWRTGMRVVARFERVDARRQLVFAPVEAGS